MSAPGLTWLPTTLALCLLAMSAPGLAAAQDAAQSQPPDATSDQAGTPSTELRIDEPFGHAWLGSAGPNVTLVVFADYACPACRDAQPVIDQLLAEDGKLRVVYRLLDNDQGGRTAALTSLAVARQGADWDKFHHSLDASGDINPKTIAAAVAASGAAKLPDLDNEQDPETEGLAEELARNDSLIVQRGGTALPTWLIGDGPAQKGFDLPRLKAAIAQARAGKHE